MPSTWAVGPGWYWSRRWRSDKTGTGGRGPSISIDRAVGARTGPDGRAKCRQYGSIAPLALGQGRYRRAQGRRYRSSRPGESRRWDGPTALAGDGCHPPGPLAQAGIGRAVGARKRPELEGQGPSISIDRAVGARIRPVPKGQGPSISIDRAVGARTRPVQKGPSAVDIGGSRRWRSDKAGTEGPSAVDIDRSRRWRSDKAGTEGPKCRRYRWIAPLALGQDRNRRAKGPELYQPGPAAQVTGLNYFRRAEGPSHPTGRERNMTVNQSQTCLSS
jgi:hypothetical protein